MHNYETALGDFPQARNPFPLVHSGLSRLLPFVEQENLQRLVDYTTPLTSAQNVAASQTPRHAVRLPERPGRAARFRACPTSASNYVANNGSGTIGFGLIASGDGLFTQTPLKHRRHHRRPVEHGRVQREHPRQRHGARERRGGRPAARGAGSARRQRHDAGRVRRRDGDVRGKRGAKWIDGHYGNTLYNHYYTPNPPGKWDCGNGSHNKGLSTARSYHTGGVNLLLADGSVRFVRDGIELCTWRGLSTRAGGEVLGDF